MKIDVSSYSALATAQKQLHETAERYAALTVNSFGGIDAVAKRGLKRYDQTGLNSFVKPVLASAGSELISGVWADAGDVMRAIAAGGSYVSTKDRASVGLHAAYKDAGCDSELTATQSLIEVAPEAVSGLRLVTNIRHDLERISPRLHRFGIYRQVASWQGMLHPS